jgi:hypothetical protein
MTATEIIQQSLNLMSVSKGGGITLNKQAMETIANELTRLQNRPAPRCPKCGSMRVRAMHYVSDCGHDHSGKVECGDCNADHREESIDAALNYWRKEKGTK